MGAGEQYPCRAIRPIVDDPMRVGIFQNNTPFEILFSAQFARVTLICDPNHFKCHDYKSPFPLL